MSEAPSKLLLRPLSAAAPGPLYQQLIDAIQREISEGRLEPGAALPSFRLLAEELLVSVITVKRAYEELEREGIIFRRQGLGTFVAEAGQARSCETQRQAAEALLRQAAAAAAQAGMKPAQFVELARKLIQEETQKS